MSEEQHLWRFLPLGYVVTVAIELPILWLLLSKRHSTKTRLIAGFWLTAVTYPIVVIVLPLVLGPDVARTTFLLLAETFAPAAECVLFYFAYSRDFPRDRAATFRDIAAVVVANVASFLTGEIYYRWNGYL